MKGSWSTMMIWTLLAHTPLLQYLPSTDHTTAPIQICSELMQSPNVDVPWPAWPNHSQGVLFIKGFIYDLAISLVQLFKSSLLHGDYLVVYSFILAFFLSWSWTVPIRLLLKSCILIEPNEKPVQWIATRFLSHIKMPWAMAHPIILLQNCLLAIFQKQHLSQLVTTELIKAFGTHLWCLGKGIISIFKPWAVLKR